MVTRPKCVKLMSSTGNGSDLLLESVDLYSM